eukprot:TRINITY_DN4540_c0_g2_i1.p1 TRINITY_DN4540_c0_g2~~TRINITY_DN4540_c0_g2_i1.p1  ORF type:complete len:205 (+),score=25.98 TRINITY_DN4540_c0_g2_i1:118-732(+)
MGIKIMFAPTTLSYIPPGASFVNAMPAPVVTAGLPYAAAPYQTVRTIPYASTIQYAAPTIPMQETVRPLVSYAPPPVIPAQYPVPQQEVILVERSSSSSRSSSYSSRSSRSQSPIPRRHHHRRRHRYPRYVEARVIPASLPVYQPSPVRVTYGAPVYEIPYKHRKRRHRKHKNKQQPYPGSPGQQLPPPTQGGPPYGGFPPPHH